MIAILVTVITLLDACKVYDKILYHVLFLQPGWYYLKYYVVCTNVNTSYLLTSKLKYEEYDSDS